MAGNIDRDFDQAEDVGPIKPTSTWRGQPKGLYSLFFSEMWERFNFYVVSFALVLYLTETLGYTKAKASDVSTWYLALVYFTPFFGGLAADRLLGYSRSILGGGLMMAAGSLMLAFDRPGMVGQPLLFGGMGMLILGNGLFKPNISALVGKLYAPDDPRRDQGFTIFYMGINVGAFLAPVVASVLRADGPGWVARLTGQPVDPGIGYNVAFAAGGLGMVVGTIIYAINRRQFRAFDEQAGQAIESAPESGKPFDVEADRALRRVQKANLIALTLGLAGLLLLPLLPWTRWIPALTQLPRWATPVTAFAVIWIAIEAITIAAFVRIGDETSRNAARLKAVFVVIALFWMAFHQNAVTLNFFAKEEIRPVGPATDPWPVSLLTDPLRYQTINALCVIVLSPIMVMIWAALAKRNRDPSPWTKMAIGMVLTGLAYVILVGAGRAGADGPGPSHAVSPYWLINTYVVLTVAELCISPVGLSLTSKLAPARYKGMWMGFWFVATAIGNKLIHVVGQYWQQVDPVTGEVVPGTYPPGTIFLVLVVTSLLAAALLPALMIALGRRRKV